MGISSGWEERKKGKEKNRNGEWGNGEREKGEREGGFFGGVPVGRAIHCLVSCVPSCMPARGGGEPLLILSPFGFGSSCGFDIDTERSQL